MVLRIFSLQTFYMSEEKGNMTRIEPIIHVRGGF